MNDFSLANEFPAASEAEWRAIVDKALAGAPFSTLRSSLYEGFETEPLYTAENSAEASANGPVFLHRGWDIVQPLTGRSFREAKSRLDMGLAGGANAVWLEIDGAECPENGNFAPQQLAGLRELFGADILNGTIPFYIGGSETTAATALFAALIESQSPEAAKAAKGSAGLDPLTGVAISGEIAADRSAALAEAVDAAFYLSAHFPDFTPFLPSDRAWHGAGGSAVQELAFTLAAAVAYWRALTEAGAPIAEAASRIAFRLTAPADIFLTIAKFRAVRLLWNRAVAAATGKPDGAAVKVIAETSYRMLSERDAHVNLLRGTAAAFGAAIGGADAIRVHPFDLIASEPGSFSCRLAHNTSLVLKHESYLDTVADAAAGSWYVESLTQELAGRAWALFREVEAKGGLAAALESGFVQAELARVRDARERAIARRKDKITGVSVFPNMQETAPSKQLTFEEPVEPLSSSAGGMLLPAPGKGERFAALVAAARGGATIAALKAASRVVKDIVAAPLVIEERAAEPFEALREGSDLALGRVGSRPPVFLALLGRADDYRARANWAQGFFAAGGIETVVPETGFEDAEALVAAFKQSPAPVACLCSSNKAYAAVKGAALALKKAGAVFIYLAGPASALGALDALDASAIDRLVYEGCDAVSILREAHLVLRVDELSSRDDDASEHGAFSLL